MNDVTVAEAMEQFWKLEKENLATDAAEKMIRHAALMPGYIAISALARMYVITATQARHVQAKLAALEHFTRERL